MRMTPVLLAACMLSSSLLSHPLPLRAQTQQRSTRIVPIVTASGGATTQAGPEWWRKRKKRFHQLALCALASGNVTYTLLVGFSGVGAAIGFTAALLGVVMCL